MFGAFKNSRRDVFSECPTALLVILMRNQAVCDGSFAINLGSKGSMSECHSCIFNRERTICKSGVQSTTPMDIQLCTYYSNQKGRLVCCREVEGCLINLL